MQERYRNTQIEKIDVLSCIDEEKAIGIIVKTPTIRIHNDDLISKKIILFIFLTSKIIKNKSITALKNHEIEAPMIPK